MYNLDNKQFLLKDSAGHTYHIYYDAARGLCMSMLKDNRVWSVPYVIHKSIFNDLYALMDTNDHIHIIFQDKTGDLYYAGGRPEQIESRILLKSKIDSPYKKNVMITVLFETLHFFYTISYQDKIILSHQILKENQISTPEALDYMDDREGNFFILKDGMNDLMVFYVGTDGEHLQAGYKKFLSLRNAWSEFNQISQSDRNCCRIRAICDRDNIIHCCYQLYTENQHDIIYQQKIAGKNMWTKPLTLYSSSNTPGLSSILQADEMIIVFWVRSDIIYSVHSTDKGNTWSRSARSTFSSGNQLACFIFYNNNTLEGQRLLCSEIPGNFIKGYSLAFMKNSETTVIQPVTGAQFKDLIVDSMNTFKENIEKLKSSEINFAQQLSVLRNEQHSSAREITKLWLKIKELENRIRALERIDEET